MRNYKRPVRRADEDDEDEIDVRVKPFKIKYAPTSTAYKITVDEPFTDVRQFEDLVEVLEIAGRNDTVEIKLTTTGGSLQSVIPLLSAMAATEAEVFVHAISDVASAGTFLLMMADDVFINPFVTVMFHQVQHGAYGQGNHVEDRVGHVSKSSKSLLALLYEDFLSESELDAMFNGKEFWMDKDDFDSRYARRMELQGAKLAAQVAKSEAAPLPPVKQSKKGKPVAA